MRRRNDSRRFASVLPVPIPGQRIYGAQSLLRIVWILQGSLAGKGCRIDHRQLLPKSEKRFRGGRTALRNSDEGNKEPHRSRWPGSISRKVDVGGKHQTGEYRSRQPAASSLNCTLAAKKVKSVVHRLDGFVSRLSRINAVHSAKRGPFCRRRSLEDNSQFALVVLSFELRHSASFLGHGKPDVGIPGRKIVFSNVMLFDLVAPRRCRDDAALPVAVRVVSHRV